MDALKEENKKLRAAIDFCQYVLSKAGDKLCGRGAYLDVMDSVRDKLWNMPDLDALFILLEYGHNEFVRSEYLVQSVLTQSDLDTVLDNYKKLETMVDVNGVDVLQLFSDLHYEDGSDLLAKMERIKQYINAEEQIHTPTQ